MDRVDSFFDDIMKDFVAKIRVLKVGNKNSGWTAARGHVPGSQGGNVKDSQPKDDSQDNSRVEISWEWGDPNQIGAPHEVRDIDKFETLKASMEEDGRQGRPLLVWGEEGNYGAITGSHRIAAAQAADIAVKIHVQDLLEKFARKERIPVWELNEDLKKYPEATLKEIGDAASLALLQQEEH